MLGLPSILILPGLSKMGFPTEVTPATQEDIRLLNNRIASNETVVQEINKWRMAHAGIDATAVGLDYPHPSARAVVLQVGQHLFSTSGIRLHLATNSTDSPNPLVFAPDPNSNSNAILIGGSYDAGTDLIQYTTTLQNDTGESLVMDMKTENGGDYYFTVLAAGTVSGGFGFTPTRIVFNNREVQVAGDFSELTIAAGVITITTSAHTVDTQSDAASDDLDTVNGGQLGQTLILTAANSARTVVCKDGTGNLKLAGDMSLDNAEDTLCLVWNGSSWLEISRSDNGA